MMSTTAATMAIQTHPGIPLVCTCPASALAGRMLMNENGP